MPIQSKYSDQCIEDILAQITAILEKNAATPDLSLMIMGNIVTNILNQDIPKAQRQFIAENFSKALLSSIEA